jgi:hypothetical protein
MEDDMNDLLAAYCFIDYLERKRQEGKPFRERVPERKGYLTRLFRRKTS